MTLEKNVENYLVAQVKKRKGRCYKWVSPGTLGVPDRLVFWPDGSIDLIELKQQGKIPRLSQRVLHAELKALGHVVRVLDSKAQIDQFLQEKELSWNV